MISIKRIKIEENLKKFSNDQFDAFFYGTDIDERTTTVIESVKIEPRHKVSFSKEEYTFKVGEDLYNILELHNFFSQKEYSSILIDSTSLDFPELLYLLKSIDQSSIDPHITLIYVEPEEYYNSIDDNQEEDYHLSDRMHPFSSLPLFTVNVQSKKDHNTVLTTFLGFENSRLGQVIVNDDAAMFKRLTACISVPAYNSGWENTSLKKHLKYFSIIRSDLKLYPGSNPYAVYELLDELYQHHEKIIIASLGTKPTAIGISIYLINNFSKNTAEKYIGAIYDFPVKTRGRSKGIGTIYSYELSFS